MAKKARPVGNWKEPPSRSFPWKVTFTWGNYQGRLVCTGLQIEEVEGSPPTGIKKSALDRLPMGLAMQSYLELLRAAAAQAPIRTGLREHDFETFAPEVTGAARHALARLGPKRKGGRLSDEFLRRLAAQAQQLWAEGDPAPNRTLALEFGERRETIRDWLHIAVKRHILPPRTTRNAPIGIPQSAEEEANK